VDEYSRRLLEAVYKVFDVLHMNITGEFGGRRGDGRETSATSEARIKCLLSEASRNLSPSAA
jgi:hypothetical protein